MENTLLFIPRLLIVPPVVIAFLLCAGAIEFIQNIPTHIATQETRKQFLKTQPIYIDCQEYNNIMDEKVNYIPYKKYIYTNVDNKMTKAYLKINKINKNMAYVVENNEIVCQGDEMSKYLYN